jgi:hypothetical protein
MPDFKMLKDTYELIMRSTPVNQPRIGQVTDGEGSSPSDESAETPMRDVVVYGQDDFMRTFGGNEVLQKLTTKDGVCVVDRMYGNAKVMF